MLTFIAFAITALICGAHTSLLMLQIVGAQWASFYRRMLVSYIVLTACTLYGVLASLILRLVGHHRMSQWATGRAFKWMMRFTAFVRFEIISGEQYLGTRPAVIVGNHQTALDVLLLGTIWPKYCSVTAKKQLKMIPFLGWFMAASGTVFLDRGNRNSTRSAFVGAAREIAENKQSVFIFPEGTRSNTSEPTLLEFKKGAFHLAIQAKVPIVPVVAGCYQGVLSIKEQRFRSGKIPVIGTPRDRFGGRKLTMKQCSNRFPQTISTPITLKM